MVKAGYAIVHQPQARGARGPWAAAACRSDIVASRRNARRGKKSSYEPASAPLHASADPGSAAQMFHAAPARNHPAEIKYPRQWTFVKSAQARTFPRVDTYRLTGSIS